MTQEELNALLNSDVSELSDEEELQEEKEEAKEELSSDFRIDQEVNWPPPPPTNEHKVVHQLDDVTRDSEVKATETFDKLEAINNAGMDIEDSVKVISGFFKSQKELLEKEGITFKRNGCVNMSKHLWDITGSLTSTIGISPTSATWQ